MYHNFVKSFGEDKFKQWEQMRKNNPKKFKQEMKKHDSLVLFMKEKYDIQESTDFETMFDLYEQKLKDDELMSRNLKKQINIKLIFIKLTLNQCKGVRNGYNKHNC